MDISYSHQAVSSVYIVLGAGWGGGGGGGWRFLFR